MRLYLIIIAKHTSFGLPGLIKVLGREVIPARCTLPTHLPRFLLKLVYTCVFNEDLRLQLGFILYWLSLVLDHVLRPLEFFNSVDFVKCFLARDQSAENCVVGAIQGGERVESYKEL